MFSQRDEEKYILEFFKDKSSGTLLDIGAYHPETFSNSRALISKGWEAVLVEPSPECFENIFHFYEDDKMVTVFNVAINTYDGEMIFYNSQGAVATGKKEHYDVWKFVQKDFKQIEVPCLTWKTFHDFIFRKKFDFINIDAEGMDWDILQQIDLDKTETKLVCVEYSYSLSDIVNYLSKFNFSLLYNNEENIIVGRE